MTLEELIRDCATRGELVHLSLWFEPIKKRWCATYAPSHKFGVSRVYDLDPVTATVKALEGISHARTRARNVIEEAPAYAPGENPEAEIGEQAVEQSAGSPAGEGDAGEGVRPEA